MIHGVANDGQDWHHPLFAAFAGYIQAITQRQIGTRQRQSLGNPEACAVEQQQHGPVARAYPVHARHFLDRIGQALRIIGRYGAGEALLDPGPAQAWRLRDVMPGLRPCEGHE